MSIFEEEKRRLDDTLQAMHNEIDAMYEKLDKLRKDGTSLSYEDRKRGAHLQINCQFDNIVDTLGVFERALSIPYFGRIDFNKNSNSGGNKIYIGKSGLAANGQTLVNDWRSPICGLYYDSELGKASYEAPNGVVDGFLTLKRQINIKGGELLDVQDSSLVTNDDLLKPYLDTNADNKMKIIIASIQKEQNAIIRRKAADNIIIQGVAGSGKTSVALHRIAYLIYNMGNQISSDQFLVLGPNKYFLNYISSILPDLETSPVNQNTLLDFTNDYLDEKNKLKLKNDEIVNIKSNKETVEKIQAFKSSLKYKNLIDKFMTDYLKNDIIQDDFVLDGEIIFTKNEIYDALFMLNNAYPNFKKANVYLVNKLKNNIDDIYDKMNKKYRSVYINLPKGDPARAEAIKKSEELSKLIKKDSVKLLTNYLKRIQKSPLMLYKLFIGNLDKYDIEELTEKEKLILQKETLLDLNKRTMSFVDLPAILHINYLYTNKDVPFRNIIIDEAQDYGLFHFAALKEIANKAVFSIYGDLAQSIYSYRSVKDWESVKKYVFEDKIDIDELNKSYRTTIEITNNANKVLDYLNLSHAKPVIRHGNNVVFEEKSKSVDYKIEKINNWINEGYKTVAVICKDDTEAKKVNKSLIENGIPSKYLSAKDEDYTGGVFVLTSGSAKGLEFDTVIINDASESKYSSDNEVDMHLLYVASTRALHEQIILYDGQITKAYSGCIDKKNENENIKTLIKK